MDKKEVIFVLLNDFADWEGHMMGWMAEKYSEVLAKVIRGDNIRFYKDYQEQILIAIPYY